MGRWRAGVGLALLLLIALPLAFPLAQLLADPSAWRGWSDAGRLLTLARNTALLLGGSLALALPPGVAGAVLLYRTDLPLRRALRLATLLALFVPLPLFTSAWQAVLGSGGSLPLPLWNPARPEEPSPGGSWSPWGQGVGSAVWLHAMAGLPWVVFLVGQALTWVERDLEEDALTVFPARQVLLRVTLPRAGAAIAAAALWVGLQTATEITVSDIMQVRTFAEEVYTQLVVPEPSSPGADPVARAVVVSLGPVALFSLLVASLARRWERTLPPRADLLTPPLLFGLGRWRWPLTAGALLACALLLGVPLASLVWKAGQSGEGARWSAGALLAQLRLRRQSDGRFLLDSLGMACTAGVACAALGLVTCWAALGARRFRNAVLLLLAVAWAMPGPVVGLGLKGSIDALLSWTGSPRLLSWALWYGPSPFPVLWVDVIRFFPCAVAYLWPLVRLWPPELRDAARVDGFTPGQELRLLIAPAFARPALRAAAVVAVLSLGELSAGKLVSTAGMQSYAEILFADMHRGVTPALAAQCLLLLAAVAAGGVLVWALGRFRRG